MVRLDEGGTLFRPDGSPVDHTWSVVDRQDRDRDGHPRELANYDTRKAARDDARGRNFEPYPNDCGSCHGKSAEDVAKCLDCGGTGEHQS